MANVWCFSCLLVIPFSYHLVFLKQIPVIAANRIGTEHATTQSGVKSNMTFYGSSFIAGSLSWSFNLQSLCNFQAVQAEKLSAEVCLQIIKVKSSYKLIERRRL